MNVLGLFAKHPVPGGVKSRLAADIGDRQAAKLYAAFIADLADRFRRTADRQFLCYWPAEPAAVEYFKSVGRADYELWPQPTGSLGQRMHQFFEQFAAGPDHRVVVVGSDSPTLPRETVVRGFDFLHDRDCVLGPATDGGYYLVGQRERARPIFESVDWSTERVLAQTVARIQGCGASLGMLPPWYDVDSLGDVRLLQGHVDALRASGTRVELENTEPLLSRVTSA